MRPALKAIEAAPERRRQVLLAEARGQKPSETVKQVDADRRQAEWLAADARERSSALWTVEQEIGEEVEAVIDAHPGHFIAAAEASSEAPAQAIAAAKEAAQAAAKAWREAGAAWSKVRMSHNRRRLDMPPEVPVNDLGGVVHTLEQAQSRPFPGGNRVVWERFLRQQAAARRSVPTNHPAPQHRKPRLWSRHCDCRRSGVTPPAPRL